MTTKKFTLSDKKVVNEIEKGTILKRFNDLFIVTEVVREKVEDPIYDALYLSNPPKPYTMRRVRQEGRYSLTSISTGSNFFDSQDTLQDLLRKIIDHDGKFEVVEQIEFKEIR